MRLRRAGIVAVAVIVGLGIAVLAVVVLGSRDSSTLDTVSGPGQVHPDQGSKHLQPGTPHAGFQYASDPPTSGPHAVTPVRRDDTELSVDQFLTALEAGDVVLVYRDPIPAGGPAAPAGRRRGRIRPGRRAGRAGGPPGTG